MLRLLDYFETQYCFGCNTKAHYFCSECIKKFSPLTGVTAHGIDFQSISTASPAMMRAIASWKDSHIKRLTKVFANLLYESEPLLQSANCLELITVPQRKSAFAFRGFYPMADLATLLTLRNPKLHFRKESSSFRFEPQDQRHLNIQDRQKNVAGAFLIEPKTKLPIVLLDDVWTSGSTMAELVREVSSTREIKKILVLAKARK